MKAKPRTRTPKLQRLLRRHKDWQRRFERAFKTSKLYEVLMEGNYINDKGKTA